MKIRYFKFSDWLENPIRYKNWFSNHEKLLLTLTDGNQQTVIHLFL